MNRYAALLEKLRPKLAPARPEDVVRRVDSDREGGLFVQTQQGDTSRWFRVRGQDVRAMDLADEDDLPLIGDEALTPRLLATTPLAWYPGRRVVLAAAEGQRATVLKGYRKRRSALAAERHGLAILASAGGPLCVPSLVAHHTRAEALEFECIVGKTLLEERQDPGDLFRIGVALRQMQRQRVPTSFELAVHDASAELGVLDVLARRVAATTDCLPQGWREVRSTLESWAPSLARCTPRLAHRDLHDRQVLVSGERLWWIDFDQLSLADPLLDAANLSAHLLLRSLQRGDNPEDRQTEAACAALLDGLDRYQSPHFWSRLRFFQSTTFLRLAAVYAMRPRWIQRTAPLVHYAERCLEERVHV